MNTEENKSTPSDNPVYPANSPSAEARTHGFWGGPPVFVHRPEPSSLADVPSGRNTLDEPTGDMTHSYDKNLTILDNGGYVLSDKSTLRLKGGGGGDYGTEAVSSAFNSPMFKTTPANRLIKRKQFGDEDTSPGSPCPYALDLEKYSDEVSDNIKDTKLILEDMIKESKIGRRWVDTITHQLDEILISNNRLGRASYKILGKFEEQREERRSLHSHFNDLHCDLGAQREKITQCLNEKENVIAELAALRTIGISVPKSSAMTPRLIPPPVEYVDLDEDCIMVVSPSGASYAATAAAKKTARKNKKIREEFPRLETPKTRIPYGSAAPIKSRLGTSKTANSGKQKAAAARQMNRARTTRVGPRFEVNTDSDGWIELRKSVEQKLPNLKVRTVRTKNGGLVLFPEDADTAAALRRTGNLIERAPRLSRVIIKYVDRLLDKEEIPWALGKNPELGINELEQKRIRPLFMLGPRSGHTVHWAIEVTPDTLKKIEGKSAYLGMTKCKMKLYDTVMQ